MPGVDLRLPEPPVLSHEGASVVAEGRRAMAAGIHENVPAPDARESFAPNVSGRLYVDLSRAKTWPDIAERLSRVSDAPNGAEVIVILPIDGRVIELDQALAGWDVLPDIRFTVQGSSTQQLRAACNGLRLAIERHAA